MRATEEALTRAEQHRRDRDSELIDDASIEDWLSRFAPLAPIGDELEGRVALRHGWVRAISDDEDRPTVVLPVRGIASTRTDL
jgi:hypothetical protein